VAHRIWACEMSSPHAKCPAPILAHLSLVCTHAQPHNTPSHIHTSTPIDGRQSERGSPENESGVPPPAGVRGIVYVCCLRGVVGGGGVQHWHRRRALIAVVVVVAAGVCGWEAAHLALPFCAPKNTQNPVDRTITQSNPILNSNSDCSFSSQKHTSTSCKTWSLC
jgi:hypothetical protein